jgi:hypothetical protein
MQYAMQLLVVILVGSAAMYLVKTLDSADAYSSHSHVYGWFWTLAYTRGVVPASLLLMSWAGAISACFYRVVVHPIMVARRDGGGCSDKMSGTSHDEKDIVPVVVVSFLDGVVPIGAAFVFNACVTVAVNALYIYSTQQALGASVHFWIQLSLSIFRLVYSAAALPLLSRTIPTVVESVRFRFILLSINNLVIPCLVTALTSEACFQVLHLLHVCVYGCMYVI